MRQILADRAKLFSYDAVIVGATDSSFLSANESRNLKDFAEIRGGGIIILGSNNFPGSIVASSSPLAAILPATIDAKALIGERASTAGTQPPLSSEARNLLIVTDAGKQSSAFGLFDDQAEKNSGFKKTGFSDSFIHVSSIAGASQVLATLTSPSKKSSPAIVASDFGAGRVLLLTPPDLYRLSFAIGSDDSFSSRFWQSLIYYSGVRGKPPIYCQTIFHTKDSTGVELIVRDSEYRAVGLNTVNAELAQMRDDGEDKTKTPVFFKPDVTSSGRFTALIDNSFDGSAMLEISGMVAKTPFNSDLLISGRDDALSFRLIPEAREQLSLRFGSNNIFDLSESDAFAKKLAAQLPSSKIVAHQFRLIDHWSIYLLIPLLLSAEFYLRRRAGIE